MAIELNYTIVPGRDKVASAKFFSRIFGLAFDESAGGYFAPVLVNDALTWILPTAIASRSITTRSR